MDPGEIIYGPGVIDINRGLKRESFEIYNSSVDPVYIGSHYHLYEVNPALTYNIDREKLIGFHLDIPAGDVVFMPPGSVRMVQAVPYSGGRAAHE